MFAATASTKKKVWVRDRDVLPSPACWSRAEERLPCSWNTSRCRCQGTAASKGIYSQDMKRPRSQPELPRRKESVRAEEKSSEGRSLRGCCSAVGGDTLRRNPVVVKCRQTARPLFEGMRGRLSDQVLRVIMLLGRSGTGLNHTKLFAPPTACVDEQRRYADLRALRTCWDKQRRSGCGEERQEQETSGPAVEHRR